MSKPVEIPEKTSRGSRMPAQFVGRVTVVRDRESEERYPSLGRAYTVLVDGEPIGSVRGRRELASTTYKGTRIRRDLGHPFRWVGYAGPYGATPFGMDTRADAAICVVERWAEGVKSV